MSEFEGKKLIYDWNSHSGESVKVWEGQEIEFDDETLRDGLQCPSITHPPIYVKLKLLHLMEKLGIQGADIGYAGSTKKTYEDVKRLAMEIRDQNMKIEPNCAARTHMADIQPVVEISEDVGIPIEVSAFIGSSPIRQLAEQWDLDRMIQMSEESVSYVTGRDMTVMYVTEDTTRADPEVLKKLYTSAIESGARRICLSDTVGHATPEGTRALVSYVREFVKDAGYKPGVEVLIDWHGHRDRGLSVANSLAALDAGANRVHGCALGIGERVGNTPMDQLLINLRMLGIINNDLTALREYCELVSEVCDVPIPANYPVMGEDAFRTSTGVHAAAVIKAQRMGDAYLADRIYSSVPASLVGKSQNIEIGPMSGLSNVTFWLEMRGIEFDENLANKILEEAKSRNRALSDKEVESFIAQIQK